VTYTYCKWGKEDVQNFRPSCTKQFEQIVLTTYNLLLTNWTNSRTRNESIVFAYENAGVLIYVVSLYKITTMTSCENYYNLTSSSMVQFRLDLIQSEMSFMYSIVNSSIRNHIKQQSVNDLYT